MSEYTKEPWHASGYEVQQDNGSTICNMSGWKNQALTKANARRIVACVNACAGIETHELELMTGDLSIHNQITHPAQKTLTPKATQYRMQRDELLYALRMITEYPLNSETSYLLARNCAEQAIAKVKGSAR